MTPELKRKLGIKRSKVSYIIVHMIRDKGLTGEKFSEKAGFSGSLLSKTVNGIESNPNVLDALRKFGIPEKYLFDPRRATLPEGMVSKKKKETV